MLEVSVIRESHERPAFAEDPSGTPAYLADRIQHMRRMSTRASVSQDLEFSGQHDVGSLRSQLMRQRITARPTLVTVTGTFFPCLLLFSSWWERQSHAKRPLHWRNDLQEWLFYGFENWGPSWDLSVVTGDETIPDVFGQIGAVDELNSLPVIVTGHQAERLRHELLVDHRVFDAKITGVLTHRSHVAPNSDGRRRWGKAFDYAIVVRDEELHAIDYQHETETYSAYLWQCWAPDEWLSPGDAPHINDVYFTWEHTDYTKDGALAYNLDGLRKKAEFLERCHGPLTLLQKSSWLVDGTPQYPTERFRSFLLEEDSMDRLPPPLLAGAEGT